jgi:hypothetical protein
MSAVGRYEARRKEYLMPTAVEDIMESVASGVLRALDARSGGGQELTSTGNLIRAGFNVSVVIRAGGIPPAEFFSALNPQPLPPGPPDGEASVE